MILSYVDIFKEKKGRTRVKAEISAIHPDSHYGQGVIVLPDGSALDLMSWIAMDYRLVRGNKKECEWLKTKGLM